NERLVFMLIDVINRANVRMIQRRGRFCLALKPLESDTVELELLRQKLQGHRSRQFRIFGLIDDTHTTAAQLLEDSVMGNDCSGFQDAVDSITRIAVPSKTARYYLTKGTRRFAVTLQESKYPYASE